MGFQALRDTWGIATRAAERAQQPPPQRSRWRLLLPVHLADSREQVRDH